MKRVSKTVAAALWLAIVLSPAINAQQPEPQNQPETPKKRAPTLTVDGPQMPRGQDGSPQSGAQGRDASGVMNGDGTPGEWARYSLEDTGVSLELPGAPQMLSVPLSNETPGGVYKSFFYTGDGVRVFISYAMTPNSREAWNFVAGWMDGLMKHLGVTDSRIEGDRNLRAKRVPIRVIGKVNGAQIEFSGTVFFIDEQQEVLMVLAEFKQANARARSVATRAVASVEVPK